MKQCKTCKEQKPLSDFYKEKKTKSGFFASCKRCCNKRSRQWDLNNPERAVEIRLKTELKKYNLSLEEYNSLLGNQGNVCSICKEPCKEKKRLCVDHDHTTGRVRGLLCNMCNRGLGAFRDSLFLLRSAEEYLIGAQEIESDDVPDNIKSKNS